jgi:hypothetical protein
MVDHIFNEARSGEILQELRAEAQRVRLERQTRQPSRRPWVARAGSVARLVAGSWLETIASGFQAGI